MDGTCVEWCLVQVPSTLSSVASLSQFPVLLAKGVGRSSPETSSVSILLFRKEQGERESFPGRDVARLGGTTAVPVGDGFLKGRWKFQNEASAHAPGRQFGLVSESWRPTLLGCRQGCLSLIGFWGLLFWGLLRPLFGAIPFNSWLRKFTTMPLPSRRGKASLLRRRNSLG